VTPVEASRLLSDGRLARRAAGGDERAFEAIFARYNQDLYRYCAAILGSAEDAHDAVQNTMLKVLRALPGEQRDLNLKPWLYRIAHNEAIDLIRARRTTEPVDVDSLVDHAGPAQKAEARDRLQLLIADISTLPDRQRGALVMRELGGLSYEQIGEALRASPAVARQTIYEARLNLRQMSEGREMPCEEVMRAISDEDGRVLRRRDIRAHLQRCESCQEFQVEISQRREKLAAIAPLPAVVSAGILQGLLGGTAAGGSGAAAAGAGGAAAGKALIGTAAIKSAAAVCAVTAVGIFAADNRGLIDLGGASRQQQDPPAGATAKPLSPQDQGNPDAVAPGVNAAGAAAAKPLRHYKREELGRAAAIERKTQSNAAPAPTTQSSSEQPTPGSNGRHLGSSKSSGRETQPSKPDHPSKGKKSPGTPPGQLKSPGQAKHAASGKSTGTKQAESHPPHPTHPQKSAQSQAPETAAAPTEVEKTDNGNKAKETGE
jgi:RNA polymerase sigma factor (sigma-70 family)